MHPHEDECECTNCALIRMFDQLLPDEEPDLTKYWEGPDWWDVPIWTGERN